MKRMNGLRPALALDRSRKMAWSAATAIVLFCCLAGWIYFPGGPRRALRSSPLVQTRIARSNHARAGSLCRVLGRMGGGGAPDATTSTTASEPSSDSKSPQLLVLCGPSAVGKGTLLQMLRERHKSLLDVAVSHTTRPPRDGEADGIHYHFVSEAKFEAMLQDKAFVEHANIHGCLYGTSRTSIENASSNGRICVLEIDVKGAKAIKASGAHAKYMFITTSGGLRSLEERLRGRKSETEEKILRRLKTAETELEFLSSNLDFFDKVLVNDNLGSALEELDSTLRGWFPCVTAFMRR